MKAIISNAVIRRLPKYLRYLDTILANGSKKISSRDIGEAMGLTPSQIRQDLNCFGGFGQQGYGYNVEFLRDEIRKIVGVSSPKEAILIGCGNLGSAIMGSSNLNDRGFVLTDVFDVSPSVVGKSLDGFTVKHLDNIEKEFNGRAPAMAILTVPKSSVNEVFKKLVDMGIKGFWNFSGEIETDRIDIAIEDVHLEDSLMTLSYQIEQLK